MVTVCLKDETDEIYQIIVTADEAKRLETGKFNSVHSIIFHNVKKSLI